MKLIYFKCKCGLAGCSNTQRDLSLGKDVLMHDPTFEKLVERLRPVYGIDAEAVAYQILLVRRNFGTTTIRRVVAGK